MPLFLVYSRSLGMSNKTQTLQGMFMKVSLLFSPAELRGHNLAKGAPKTKRSFPAHVE
jgi:hypothetical protein